MASEVRFNVGDHCSIDRWNLEAGYLIRHIDEDGTVLLRITHADGSGFSFQLSNVASLLPYAPPIVVGSQVRYAAGSVIGRVLALDNQNAWIKWDDNNNYSMTYLPNLVHAEQTP